MVTRETPGTCFMPSFCIAFLLFFSDRLCFPLEGVPSSAGAPGSAGEGGRCPGARTGRTRLLCVPRIVVAVQGGLLVVVDLLRGQAGAGAQIRGKAADRSPAGAPRSRWPRVPPPWSWLLHTPPQSPGRLEQAC